MVSEYMQTNIKYINNIHNYSTMTNKNNDFCIEKANTSRSMNFVCKMELTVFHTK